MYSKGEYVVYGTNGICEIGEITTLDLDGVSKDREYFILYPRNNGGKIYVPVDTASSKMRKLITKEEARKLISKMPTIEPLEETNEKALEDSYKKCIRSFECTEWIRLIKCIYYRKQIRLANGKKTTATDNKYMHLAEEALYQELGIALDIPKEQVVEYVFKEIEKNSEKP